MFNWNLGTIGFTYPEWKGSFYPVGLPSGQSLRYYSRVFNAVEINTTFYGPQSPAQIQKWAANTPEDFCFSLKAPRRITHELRLQNANAEMLAFLESSAGLGNKFGAVLIQLPPSFTAEDRPIMAQFLKDLPRAFRYAVEFRHSSWYVPATADLLREYQVSWTATDYEDLPIAVTPTTDFLYLRWIGKHNVLAHPGHEVIDRGARLQTWWGLIQPHLDQVQQVFGFFDNDYAGYAPATCNRWKEIVGLPTAPSAADEQGRLF